MFWTSFELSENFERHFRGITSRHQELLRRHANNSFAIWNTIMRQDGRIWSVYRISGPQTVRGAIDRPAACGRDNILTECHRVLCHCVTIPPPSDKFCIPPPLPHTPSPLTSAAQLCNGCGRSSPHCGPSISANLSAPVDILANFLHRPNLSVFVAALKLGPPISSS